jgi:thymidylate synthase
VDYLLAELKWYESGDLSVREIEKYSKMWGQLKDGDGMVNSNYGFMVWKQFCPTTKSQFDWVIDSLIKDRDSRQAVINFNQVAHKYEGNRDFPCTLNAQFLVRDNKLVEIVNMRSNDLVYGTCYDVPFFMLLQLQVYDVLRKHEGFEDLKLGVYVHNVGSLHVYERHFEMLDNLCREAMCNDAKVEYRFSLK